MKRIQTNKRGLIVLAALLMLAAPGVANARGGENSEDRRLTQTETMPQEDVQTTREGVGDREAQRRDSIEQRVQAARERAEARTANAEARLEKAQLKRCDARETAIQNTMARIADRGDKQVALFKTIANRVIAFHEEKGTDFEGYTDLEDAVLKAEADATLALSEIRTASTADFECEGDNPRQKVETFKESLRIQIDVLKTYKTAVKDLIVGVKTAQNAETTDTEEQTDTIEEGVQE